MTHRYRRNVLVILLQNDATTSMLIYAFVHSLAHYNGCEMYTIAY